LASGLLTGKYNDGVAADTRLGQEGNAWLQRMVLGEQKEQRIEKVRRFTALAAELGGTPSQLAIAWCLRNPHVSTVMLGASSTAQLIENLGALDLVGRYDEGTWARLEAATCK
jgi:aryl-alcohol dehydrogenase-like predicted oxidoreductase